MNELDKLMQEYQPLSPKLGEQELKRLSERVHSKRYVRKRPVKLLLVLAAAMCLLAACGAAVIGLFDSMTNVNQTQEMVKKYGFMIADQPSVMVDGHEVSVQAVIRSRSIARVIYDISGSQNDTVEYRTFKDQDGTSILRIQFQSDAQVSDIAADEEEQPAADNLVRMSGKIGPIPGANATRFFADVELPSGSEHISLYVLAEAAAAQVIELTLPQEITEQVAAVADAVVRFETTSKEEVECMVEEIVITPFSIILHGQYRGQMQKYSDETVDWSKLIQLFDAKGRQIQIGRNGSFFAGSGEIRNEDDPQFYVEFSAYDLIDPAAVAEIQINGRRYPVSS